MEEEQKRLVRFVRGFRFHRPGETTSMNKKKADRLSRRGVVTQIETFKVRDLLLCEYGELVNAEWGYVPECGTMVVHADIKKPQRGIFVYKKPVVRDNFMYDRELLDGDVYLHVATGKKIISTNYYEAYNALQSGMWVVDATNNIPEKVSKKYEDVILRNGWDANSELTSTEVGYLEDQIKERLATHKNVAETEDGRSI